MCVVRAISSCKQAMTINCFSLVLSSLFRPLFVTFFTIGFAFPYFSCCSAVLPPSPPWAPAYKGDGKLQRSGCPQHPCCSWVPHPTLRASTKYQVTPAGAGCGWVCWQERSARGDVRFCCHKTLSAIFSCSLWHRTAAPDSHLGIQAAQL